MKTRSRNLLATILPVIAILLLMAFAALSVEATTDEYSCITVDNGKYLYDYSGDNTIETVPGASYDIDTNVLTLNGYNGGPISLDYMHGTKILIVGENTINYNSDELAYALNGYSGELTIIGDGQLTINDSNTTEGNFSYWGAIAALFEPIEIDGPTININSTVNNGIFTRGNIRIKNSVINIENVGVEGISSMSGYVHITDSDVNISAKQHGIIANTINLYGNTKLNVKTTNNDSNEITLYSRNNDFAFNTTGSIVLEKSDTGRFFEATPATEHNTYDVIYEYSVTSEANKTTYTLNKITDKTLIDLIEIDGTDIVPIVEQAPKALNISSEKYEIVEQYWFDEYENYVTQFEKGKYYGIEVLMRPKGQYYFNASTELKFSHSEYGGTHFCTEEYDIIYYGDLSAYAMFYIPGDHQIISGADQTYVIGSNEQLVFEISGNKSELDKIYIDWRKLRPSDYSVSGDESTTIITINQGALDSFELDEYSLGVYYKDTQVVKTNLTISDQPKDDGNACKNGHTESSWKSDAENHWKECTVADCGVIIGSGKAVHIDDNGDNKCDTCNYEMPAHDPDNPDTPPAQNPPTDDNDGVGTGAIIGIVAAAVAVIGGGGYALFWFVIKKKKWSDFINIFKK